MKSKNHNNYFQFFLLILLVLTFQSCQYFEKKVPNENELLQKRLQEINWDEVDEYPSITNCDSVEDSEQRKQCFFDCLTADIRQRLIDDKVYVKFPTIDSLKINVTVFPDSNIEFKALINDSLAIEKEKMDSILNVNLANFQKINPALKRGIPVKTNFVLPVKLKPN